MFEKVLGSRSSVGKRAPITFTQIDSLTTKEYSMKMTYLVISVLVKQAALALIVGLLAIAAVAAYMVVTAAVTFTGGLFISGSTVALGAIIVGSTAASSFVVGSAMSFFSMYKLHKAGVLDPYVEETWEQARSIFTRGRKEEHAVS